MRVLQGQAPSHDKLSLIFRWGSWSGDPLSTGLSRDLQPRAPTVEHADNRHLLGRSEVQRREGRHLGPSEGIPVAVFGVRSDLTVCSYWRIDVGTVVESCGVGRRPKRAQHNMCMYNTYSASSTCPVGGSGLAGTVMEHATEWLRIWR